MKVILKIFLCLENKEIHFKMFYEILFIEDIDLLKKTLDIPQYAHFCSILPHAKFWVQYQTFF